MNYRLILTVLGSCYHGITLNAATTDFVTPNNIFGTIEPAVASSKHDNTLDKFISPDVINYFTDPIKYGVPPSYLRQVIAYPLRQTGTASNRHNKDEEDESDKENNDENNTELPADNSGMMYMSIMEGSFFDETGAGIEGENAEQIAGDIFALPEFEVDARHYPLLHQYYHEIELNFSLRGTIPDAMLRDIEALLEEAENNYGRLSNIPATAPIRQFFRWARASGAIYTLKLMYEKPDKGTYDNPAKGTYEKPVKGMLNRQLLKACIKNINRVIVFYNLLSNLQISTNALLFSDFFQAYLLNFVEGEFSIDDTTISASNQIVSLLFSVITYKSHLLNEITKKKILHFNYENFYRERKVYKNRYPHLLTFLNQFFTNLIDDGRKRKRLAEAFIYMLLSEGILLQQLENSTLYEYGSESSAESLTVTPHELLTPRALDTLNSLASQGGETGTSAAVTVVALMHIPSLITTFNRLAATHDHNLPAFAAMVKWLHTYFTRLQSGIPSRQDIPLIRATLSSFFQQGASSIHRASSHSYDHCLEVLLIAAISEWLNVQRQQDEDFEAVGFNVEGAHHVLTNGLEPESVASQLLTLYPSLYTRLSQQPALQNLHGETDQPDQSQKNAIEKVLRELALESSPREADE